MPDDVFSGRNIKTIQVLGASFSTFRDFPKTSFRDVAFGDGSGGMNSICSRPEVTDES